ncbi:MAG: PAS domain S-box protein [Burkholderiales bacterium]|nr:PAS domain S-box protein [Burkholderiales bacterium]
MSIEPGAAPGAGDLGALLDLTPALVQPLIDAIPARVVVLDADEILRYANHEFFAFTRLHPKQVLGRHIAQIIGAETHATYAPARERLLRGETARWEGWTELAGVGRRYMREHLVPIGPPAQPLRGMIVISLDWTELKQREAELATKLDELQTTEALKSSIFDHALAALVSTDAEGRVVEFNPAAEAMFGIQREQVLGRPVADIIIPQRHRAAHDAGIARMADGGEPRLIGRRQEMEAQRADGREFPIEMVLWRTAAAGRTFYTASMFDLTERRGAAREIERQREALRQSEKLTAMGSLLAGVAHELNNPLAIVMGRASLLEDKTAGSPLASDAQRIREAAERCGRIVRTFLNMARSRPAQRGPVALNELVMAALDMVQYGLRTHGIAVSLELQAELPPVMADADQMGQIVLNLIVNAQQALAADEDDGPRRLTVSSGVEPRREGRDPRVWLRVADSGRGVPAEVADRIFEPFFTTKPEGMGTGLGLPVSRSLAREHGGDLVLEPRKGSGACFRLSLPISGEAAERSLPVPLDEPDADQNEIADLMRDFLESGGYEVVTAESGAVALQMLAEARFDAIVSDLRMPDIDGAALWRQVKQRTPALARRMVFVTGDTLSPGARSFLAETGCPSLDKPFARGDLLERVRALLAA